MSRIPLYLKLCLISFAVAGMIALLSLIDGLREWIALRPAHASPLEPYDVLGLGRHGLMLLSSFLFSWLILTRPGRTALWAGRLGVLFLLLLTLAGLPQLFHEINVGMRPMTGALPVLLALCWLCALLLTVFVVRAKPAAKP